jgi:hypothetical protein
MAQDRRGRHLEPFLFHIPLSRDDNRKLYIVVIPYWFRLVEINNTE